MDDADILATMRRRLQQAEAATADSRRSQLDDARFNAGSPDNMWQWPAEALVARTNDGSYRPCLTINKIPQHVHQITNEQRINRPAIKIIPVNDGADEEVAEVIAGIVRHIEYISDADVAYATACDNQVVSGEGYIRILTDFIEAEDGFNQEIRIERVRNPFSVYMDPLMQDMTGADANWAFLVSEMAHEDYERAFPDASPVSTLSLGGVGDRTLAEWCDTKTVRIAEYFWVETRWDTLNLYPGNQVVVSGSEEDAILAARFGKAIKSRRKERRDVKWLKSNGSEVLDRGDWPGKWIPIVRVVGNEFEIDGQIHVSGLVRNAKDAQRMYNYWSSNEAEMIALAPKAPFIGYSGQFEGFEDKWRSANVRNWPYLEVNRDATDYDGRVLPLPMRSAPPQTQTAIIQAKLGAADDIKSTTGQYDSSLGQMGNETSGKAIVARERQGDTGTYHYGSNLALMIRQAGRQIVDLIPKIMDTRQVARIVGLDDEIDMVRIDPAQREAVRELRDENGAVMAKVFNPNVGRYDVVATVGPGYMTQRQEAMEAMGGMLQGNPDLWRIAGDIFARNMDWPGADELSARLRKAVDPAMLEDDDSPELGAARAQMEAMGQQIEQLTQMVRQAESSIEAREIGVKEYEAETRRMVALGSALSEEQVQDIAAGVVAAAAQDG